MIRKRWRSVNEVALILGVSPRTVRRWWLSGRTCLQAWTPPGCESARSLRFTTESVEQFECEGRICPDEYKNT